MMIATGSPAMEYVAQASENGQVGDSLWLEFNRS